jgi:hypothetical protein
MVVYSACTRRSVDTLVAKPTYVGSNPIRTSATLKIAPDRESGGGFGRPMTKPFDTSPEAHELQLAGHGPVSPAPTENHAERALLAFLHGQRVQAATKGTTP